LNVIESSFDFLSAARQLIGYDTSPFSSTVETADFIKSICDLLSLECEIQNEVQNGVAQANVLIRPFPKEPGQSFFLLQSHLDTADPGAVNLWKNNNNNPFDAVIDESFIYGLGSAEVKVDFLCKLVALSKAKKNLTADAPLLPLLVGTFGEETGMQGALKLIRKNKLNARYALISEPSNLEIIHAAKGFVTVEIRVPMGEQDLHMKEKLAESINLSTQNKLFSGVATHSSTPHLGENAAVKMLDFMNQLPDETIVLDLEAGTRFNTVPSQASVEYLSLTDNHIKAPDTILQFTLSKIKKIYSLLNDIQNEMLQSSDDEFEPKHSTFSIGVVKTFEDYILIGGSCRIVPTVQQEVYDQWIKKFHQSCQSIGAEFHLQDYKKPFRTSRKSILVKAVQSELEKMDLPTTCRTMASANEASFFSRVGIECVCIGVGVREGNIHTPQEKVALSQIEQAKIFYQRMIERLCVI
jgi:acetylornithine deacetylase/succinyl-diaminopimelate desuccinylase-like protein